MSKRHNISIKINLCILIQVIAVFGNVFPIVCGIPSPTSSIFGNGNANTHKINFIIASDKKLYVEKSKKNLDIKSNLSIIRGGAGWFGLGDDNDDEKKKNNSDNEKRQTNNYGMGDDQERKRQRPPPQFPPPPPPFPPPPPPPPPMHQQQHGQFSSPYYSIDEDNYDDDNVSDDNDNESEDENGDYDGSISSNYPPPPPPETSNLNTNTMDPWQMQQRQQYQQPFDTTTFQPYDYDYYNPNSLPTPPQMDPSSPYYYPIIPPIQQEQHQDHYGKQKNQQTSQDNGENFSAQSDWKNRQSFQSQQLQVQEETKTLQNEIFNLTIQIQEYKNETKSQQTVIDNLTDELSTSNNKLSQTQNNLKEIQHNATKFEKNWSECQTQLETMKETLKEWKSDKIIWERQEEEMEEKLKCTKQEIEELSFLLEQIREEKEFGSITTSSSSSLSSSTLIPDSKTKSKSKGGFLYSLLNILFMRSPSPFLNSETLTNEENAKKWNLTRTTLTTALTEARAHVSDLEYLLDEMSQNNTALAEVIESRDALISELHNRVQVFEEDKLVLKAALRQLQREMKEEIGPAREKLEMELRDKSDDIAHLQNTITTLEQTHEHQLLQVQTQLFDTKKELNATTLEISTIGLYVDKLEDRLANFAMSKREFIQEKEDTRNEVITILEGVEEERAKWELEKNLLLKEVENWKDRMREKEQKMEAIEEKIMILEEEKEEMMKARNKIEESNKIDNNIVSDFTSTSKDVKECKDNDMVTNKHEEINPNEIHNVLNTEVEVDASAKLVAPADPNMESSIHDKGIHVWEESEHEKENNLWDDSSYDNTDEGILSQDEDDNHVIQNKSKNENTPNIPVNFPAPELPQKTILASHDNVAAKDNVSNPESKNKDGKVIDEHRKDENRVPNQIKNQKIPYARTQPPLGSRPPPFRNLRKTFSRVTGMHGTFTPQYEERKRRREFIEMMRRKEMILNGERLRSESPPNTLNSNNDVRKIDP